MANLELIKELHEIYCIHGERGKDDTLEEALLPKDEEYGTEVELNAHKALDVHAEYEKSLATVEKAKTDWERGRLSRRLSLKQMRSSQERWKQKF